MFDRLWNGEPSKRARRAARRRAYADLAVFLGKNPDDTHIGLFDVETCRRAFEFAARAQSTPATPSSWEDIGEDEPSVFGDEAESFILPDVGDR